MISKDVREMLIKMENVLPEIIQNQEKMMKLLKDLTSDNNKKPKE